MRTAEDVRVCTGCGISKTADEFGNDKSTKTGKRHYCRKCDVDRYTDYRQRKIEDGTWQAQWQAVHRRSKYGIEPEDFQAMWDHQEGRCGICRISLKEVKTCIDHDHESGVVRGLLCDSCNVGIARFKENSLALLGAAAYLEAGGYH